MPVLPAVSSKLLQQNADKLAKLEVEWSDLGPLRQFDYHCRFPDLERAHAFCLKAQGVGCATSVSVCESQHTVTASKRMKPTAENVTLLQEQLASFLEDGDPDEWSYVDGWSYPPKKRVHFWPSSTNKHAAEARAAVLFDGELVEDPLGRRTFATSRQSSSTASTFTVDPSKFLRRARMMKPHSPQPTASGFSQWVYSLYGRNDGSDEDVADGKDAEQHIWERRRSAASCNDDRFLRGRGWNWSLLHNGLNLRDHKSGHYSIPDLSVNGEPLRASPDLVYTNADRSEVMIVEIKFSRQALPRNLWPNVWAQLWCYAQLDHARSASKVTAVAEIWGEEWTRGFRRRNGYEPGKALVCLRASVRRDPRAAAYDRFFRELFRIYSGARQRGS